MSRAKPDAAIGNTANATSLVGPGVRFLYAQSASVADLEARVNAIVAEQFADGSGTWRLSLLHLAGGGSGHTFGMLLGFNDSAVNPQGENMEPPGYIALFEAANAQAIEPYRELAQERAVNALGPLPDMGRYVHLQSWLSGAQQGTKFMGAELFTVTIIIPPPP